jgi:hypothetical protein
MSESNLTEKISDTITNVIKKTKFFEKLQNIEFYFTSFVMVSSVVGITGLVIHYYNANEIKKNQEEINNLRQDIITYNIDMITTIKQLCVEEKFDNLEKKILKSIENQLITLNEIKNLPLLSVGKIDKLSRSTSVSSIFLESIPQKVSSINSDEGWHISEEEKNKCEDNDLLNDCYDTMPLSNVKKVTGIKGWFI